MIKSKLFSKNSSAASPVIGVMLMVVVTVILAAAVSSYSTGMMKGSQVVPSAAFNVEMRVDVPSPHGNVSYIAITMMTGDKIPTRDMKIITINPNARGDNKTREILPNVNNTKTQFYNGISPFLNIGQTLNDNSQGVYFGQFVLEPGMTMITDEYSNYYSGAVWNEDIGDYICTPDGYITGMQTMFADWADGSGTVDIDTRTIHSGDVVTIKIVHTPTNKVIFAKDVVVT